MPVGTAQKDRPEFDSFDRVGGIIAAAADQADVLNPLDALTHPEFRRFHVVSILLRAVGSLLRGEPLFATYLIEIRSATKPSAWARGQPSLPDAPRFLKLPRNPRARSRRASARSNGHGVSRRSSVGGAGGLSHMAHEAGPGGGGVSDALGATVGSLGNAIGATIIGAFVVWLACGFTMALSLLGLTSSVSPAATPSLPKETPGRRRELRRWRARRRRPRSLRSSSPSAPPGRRA